YAATPDRYTLSLHDALPICFIEGHGHFTSLCSWDSCRQFRRSIHSHNKIIPTWRRATSVRTVDGSRCLGCSICDWRRGRLFTTLDRKSTRLNSSHVSISYAV